MSDIQVTKSNGVLETFNEKKLIKSLKKSQASDEEIEYTLHTVKSKIKAGITTSDLYQIVFETLKNIRKYNPNAIRYALKRSVMDLGPTGFPFEKFIARVFQKMGYKCVTGVTVQGNCIEHEVDIFAHKDGEAICIEAKFHNEPHLKSDTKVALYVKARFDDLLGRDIVYGNLDLKITKGILITNTTFTHTAHSYVDCVGTFELLSWNKPQDKNLLHYIEAYKLYPVTVVPDLTQKEINFLIQQEILTCADLRDHISILNQMKIKKPKQEIIIRVLDDICGC